MDATLKNLHSMAQLNQLDGNANANDNAKEDEEEAFAHSLCEECFVAFQQARGQGQSNGNHGDVVVAVEVVVVAKVKAKDNGIGEGKSKKTTLKRPSLSPPCFAPIA